MKCVSIKNLNRLPTYLSITLGLFFCVKAQTSPEKEDEIIPIAPKCGLTDKKPEIRIIGGTEATEGTWPWIASLGYTDRRKFNIYWKCAGSLINERFILTAAHCNMVKAHRLYIVRMGSIDIAADTDPANDYLAEKIIDHPNFSGNKARAYDISLIKLNRPVKFSLNIYPICLPATPEIVKTKLQYRTASLAGWGQQYFNGPFSQRLMNVDVEIFDNSICEKGYKMKLLSSHLCAGNRNGGKDGCLGDSGGPLVLIENEIYYLIGIVSFGINCGEPDKPGVYTSVKKFMPWILQTLEKNM